MTQPVVTTVQTGEFYSVTQLANELGITPRTVRFYEDKGLIAPRRAGNNRVYTRSDRARMILILRGKTLGFSLREIKEYLDLYVVDSTGAAQLKALLKAAQSRILQLEHQRVALEQTLVDLREVEAQTLLSLEALDSPPRLATG